MKKERKKERKDQKEREKKEAEKVVEKEDEIGKGNKEKMTKDPFGRLREAVESEVVVSMSRESGVKRKLLEESFEQAKKTMKVRLQPLEQETIEATSVLVGILEDEDHESRRNLDRFERQRYSERLNQEADERERLLQEMMELDASMAQYK